MGAPVPSYWVADALNAQAQMREHSNTAPSPRDDSVIDVPPEDIVDITEQKHLTHESENPT